MFWSRNMFNSLEYFFISFTFIQNSSLGNRTRWKIGNLNRTFSNLPNSDVLKGRGKFYISFVIPLKRCWKMGEIMYCEMLIYWIIGVYGLCLTRKTYIYYLSQYRYMIVNGGKSSIAWHGVSVKGMILRS